MTPFGALSRLGKLALPRFTRVQQHCKSPYPREHVRGKEEGTPWAAYPYWSEFVSIRDCPRLIKISQSCGTSTSANTQKHDSLVWRSGGLAVWRSGGRRFNPVRAVGSKNCLKKKRSRKISGAFRVSGPDSVPGRQLHRPSTRSARQLLDVPGSVSIPSFGIRRVLASRAVLQPG